MSRGVVLLLAVLAACRTPPEVVREVLPEGAEVAGSLRWEGGGGVVVVARHLDRRELFALSRWNRPDAACDGTDPVLAVFHVSVSNRTPDRVLRFDTARAVLDDGEERPALTRERFREVHPPVVEAACRYEFLFDEAVAFGPPVRRWFRRELGRTSLTRSGVVPPGGSVEALVVFERPTLFARTVGLRFPGWVLTNAHAPNRPLEVEMRYRQRVVRAKED